MAVRTLTELELRLALLRRQGLLNPFPSSVARTIERVGSLQTQYAPSAYVGLRARMAGFERDQLTRALQRRSVIQGTMMRSTIHMVTRTDYWPVASAIREPRREWWLRVVRHGQTEADMRRAADRVRRALADGPRRARELKADLDTATWNGVGLWLDLVRVPPSGTWERRRANLYALAEDWVGPDDAAPDEGRALLVERYLAGFGPAAASDIATFTQLPMQLLQPVVHRLRLRRFRADDGTDLHDIPRGPLPDPATPVRPVIFIGTWDAILLVHARRTAVLPEKHRSKVFHTRIPQSVPTFLVDGQVAGSWRYENGHVTVTPFEKLSASVMRRVKVEADRLAEFHD